MYFFILVIILEWAGSYEYGRPKLHIACVTIIIIKICGKADSCQENPLGD